MMDPTAPIKAQAIAENQASALAKAPRLHAEARERAGHSLALSRAVGHLNKQAERGEHDPVLGWNVMETQVT